MPAATRDTGEDVVVLGEPSSGDPDRVAGVPIVVGSLHDGDLVQQANPEHGVRRAVHLAVDMQVEESAPSAARPGR